MRLAITPELRTLLQARRRSVHPDPVAQRLDGVLLYGDIGGRVYLGIDGRAWCEEAWSDGEPREATCSETWVALVSAARRSELEPLLSLLPARPVDARTCPACDGGRWVTLPPSGVHRFVCNRCLGLGWRAPALPVP